MSGILSLFQMQDDDGGGIPQVRVSFWNGSGADIAKGDTVAIDGSVTTYGLGAAVKVGPSTISAPVLGLAVETIEDDTFGEVCIWGIVDDAAVLTGVAAGSELVQGGATDGRMIAAAANTDQRVGVSLELAAGNKAKVFVGV